MKNKSWILLIAATLAACGGQQQTAQDSKDQQIADNAKQIELLKQQAEIQRLQNELNANAASDAQVYQLAPSEVANTIPTEAQANAKAGDIVQGKDGQQYTYDPDTGNWLLYGAIGAAAGYLMANAMNNRNAAKYTPVQKPTAAVERVHKDYRAANPTPPRANANAANNNVSPRQAIAPNNQNNAQNQPRTQPQQQMQQRSTPAYRPTNQGYSNTRSFGGGARRRR